MDELIEEHYTHFLLAHTEILKDFILRSSDNYYQDIDLIKMIYIESCDNYFDSEFFKLNRVGLADVIYQEDFIKDAMTKYDNKRMV